MSAPIDEPNAKLLRAIIQAGPRNFSLLSRITGMPAETVRYKIKKQLASKGIYIHAISDATKFDLRRITVRIKFTEKYHPVSKSILQALHELSYLTYYSGELMTRWYYCMFQVPSKFAREFSEFLDAMSELGILESYVLRPIDWINYVSMRPEFFDLHRGMWDIDWAQLKLLDDLPKVSADQADGSEFDKTDLLITKELTIDSLTTVAEMSKKLNVNVKTLQYHYGSHLLERGMIKNFVVRWMGDVESARKHKIVYLRLYFKDLNRKDMESTRRTMYTLPFTWSEIISDNRRLFVSEAGVPVEQLVDCRYFLNNYLGELADGVEERMVDGTSSMAFTVPHGLYDSESRLWTYPLEQNVSRLQNLVQAYN